MKKAEILKSLKKHLIKENQEIQQIGLIRIGKITTRKQKS